MNRGICLRPLGLRHAAMAGSSGMASVFSLGWRSVSDTLHKAAVVEPAARSSLANSTASTLHHGMYRRRERCQRDCQRFRPNVSRVQVSGKARAVKTASCCSHHRSPISKICRILAASDMVGFIVSVGASRLFSSRSLRERIALTSSAIDGRSWSRAPIVS